MTKLTSRLCLVLATGALLALSHGVASAQEDETTTVASTSEAGAENAGSYFYVRQDFRRCMYPYCGGVFVHAANRWWTRCPDGFYRPECYVADFEVDRLGLSHQGEVQLRRLIVQEQVLLRGELFSATSEGYWGFGRLSTTEAWETPGDDNSCRLVTRIKTSGIVCITSPCPIFIEELVNGGSAREVAEVDFGRAGASDEQLARAQAALHSEEGLLVFGSSFPVTGPAGEGIGRSVDQFFTPYEPPVIEGACVRSGCSGQICGEESVVTTCEFRPEYTCLQNAACERQVDGRCGFTQTPELEECLASWP